MSLLLLSCFRVVSIATVCQEDGGFEDINYERAWDIKVAVTRQLQPVEWAIGHWVDLPLIALIHLTKLTKNQEFRCANQLYSKMGYRD